MLPTETVVAYQHAVIEDSQLETYTGHGWELVQLLEIPGTEMVHKIARFEHTMQNQSYPVVNQYNDQSGNFIRWSMMKALVRRPKEHQSLEDESVALRQDLADAQHNMELMHNEFGTKEKLIKGLEAAIEEQRRGLDTKVEANNNLMKELDVLKKQLVTIELDIGKREMDRILGRFPMPVSAIDLGEEKT